MDKMIRYRILTGEEIQGALELSLSVFTECNFSDFDEQGFASFKSFIESREHINQLTLYGAFMEAALTGVLATKESGTHISLFFVDKKYQGKGIGKGLFTLLMQDRNPSGITVNSSLYAVPVYKKLGFTEVGQPVTHNGLKFVPMKFITPGSIK